MPSSKSNVRNKISYFPLFFYVHTTIRSNGRNENIHYYREFIAREVPVLELYPKDIQPVTLGGSADLQCRAIAGLPLPEIHWSRQDGRSFAPNIEQLPGGLLRFSNITINDGGSYVCSATNEVGSVSEIAHIEVQSIPVITIEPRAGILQVKLGDRVRLACSAVGHPQPNVAWSKHVNGLAT